MIGDRDYMREGRYRAPMSLTVILMIILVAAFALQSIVEAYAGGFPYGWLALTRSCFKDGWVWQLITFQFLHGGVFHLLFNLLVFWWAGRFTESVLGKTRFLVAYFASGIIGGILQGALMALFPRYGLFTVGASAGIAGILAIYCMLRPHDTIVLFFILPVRAIVLLYGSLAIALFFTLVPSRLGGCDAHAAHLGGLLTGIAWVKLGWHHDYIRLPWERLMEAWRARRARRPIRFPQGGGMRNATAAAAARSRKESVAKSGPTEFISKEVDPILDKIAAKGIHSLTEEEKKILASARSRMERR